MARNLNQKPPTRFTQAVGLCYYFPNDTRRNRVVHVEALRDGRPAGLFFKYKTRGVNLGMTNVL